MKHWIRSITFFTGMLLSFYSSRAQYAPIKPTGVLNPEISTMTQGIADEIPHAYAEDADGTLYVAGAYNYSGFLGKYNPASPGSFSWLIKLDGRTGYEGIKHIFLGADNSVNVITANIESTTDLDPGPGTVTISNAFDLVWIKYRKDGSFISARKLTESIGNPYCYVFNAANDAAGNVYVYGSTYSYDQRRGSKDLDPGAGSFLVGEAQFLAKYNMSGGLVWAKTFPQNQSWTVRDLKVSGDAVYLGGHFTSTVDFDPDAGFHILTSTPASSTATSRDAFLARYDGATGAYTWAFRVGTSGGDGIEKMVIHNDAVTVCGVYTYAGGEGVDFDPSAERAYMLKGGLDGGQLFVATYSFNKELRSATRLTESAPRPFYDDSFTLKSFTVDAQGQYYIGGNLSFPSATRWDIDPSQNQFLLPLRTGYASTGYILKYTGAGALAWGAAYHQSGGWYNQLGHFFPSRAANTPYVVIGMYQGSTSLDPVNGGVQLSSSRYDSFHQKHYQEMFIASYCELTAIPTPASEWPQYVRPATAARFSIHPVAGATSYTWSVPSGFNISGASDTTEIVVIPNASAVSGTISVRAVNACGASAAYSFAVTVVPKLPATVTLSNLTQMYSGNFIRPTVVTNPTGLNVKLLYNGSTLPPKDAGAYTVEAIIETSTYEGSATGTLVIEKATQVIMVDSIPEMVMGGGTVTIPAYASSGLPVTIVAQPAYLVSIQGTAVTPLTAGTVQLTFSQAGNNNYQAAAARQFSFCIRPPKPAIEITSGLPEYAELRSSIKLNNQWYKDGVPMVGAVEQTYFTTESGIYQVKITRNGCANISDPVRVYLGENESFSVSSYPNPTIETVTVNMSSPAADASIAIFNDKGLKVLEVTQAKENNELQVSHLPAGIYHLVIWDGRQKKSQRLLKK